jgi:hypothetical protein
VTRRFAGILIVAVLFGAGSYGAARAAMSGRDQMLHALDGGFVDACHVERVVPGTLVIGDGTLVLPVVRVVLDQRDRVVLAADEGDAGTVAQTILSVQDDCHRVTLSEAQLEELAKLIKASP